MPEESLPLSVEMRIDAACQSFEAAWQAAGDAGTGPRIEDYLGAAAEPERQALLGELLKVELHYRRGEQPAPEEYLQRFPQDEPLIAHLFGQVASGLCPLQERSGGRETVKAATAPETGFDPNRTAAESPPGTPEKREPAGGATTLPTVPGYEVLGVLGRGGMGVVYKARHVQLKRLVALKMILAGAHAGPEELARFRTEAEAVASLQHPNIVQIYEIGEQEGLPYFSLEFLDGGSLHQKLAGAPQQPEAAAFLLETLARAMYAAHQRGIVHRDLKPANVLLTTDGVPKVTDFGLAKHLDEDSGRTQSGAIMGTPSYMAPEQAAGQTKEIGPLADVYAVGAILYEMLTGRPPFKGTTVRDTLDQVCSQDPVLPRQLQPKVPRDLETICLKCLRKEPHLRYTSAAELGDDLRRFRERRPILARPIGPVEMVLKWANRRPAVASLLAAVVVVTAVGFAGTLWQYRQAVKQTETAQNETLLKGVALSRALEAERQAGERANGEKQAREEVSRQFARMRRLGMIGQTLRAQMTLASDPEQARNLLEDCDYCPLDLRDFAWGFNYRLSKRLEPSRSLRGLAKEAIRVFTFTPDGRTLVTTGFTGVVRLWDVSTGRERTPHSMADRSGGAISADGKLLALRDQASSVALLDLATGKQRLIGDKDPDWCFPWAFSPDGAILVMASQDGLLRLLDVASGTNRATLQGSWHFISAVAFAPDGTTLATSGDDRMVRLWDVASGRERARFACHCQTVAFSPDGKLLAAGDPSAAFSPDGKTLAVGGLGEGATLFDLETDRERARFQAKVVGGVTFWDIATGQERLRIQGHAAPVSALAFAANGKILASGADDGTVKLWDAAVPQLTTLDRSCGPVAFSPDGTILATCAQARAAWDAPGTLIQFWDMKTGQELAALGRHATGIVALTFSQDGSVLASAGADNRVKLWDVSGRKELAFIRGLHGSVSAIALSADGKTWASAGKELNPSRDGLLGEIKVWDMATGQEQAALPKQPGLFTCLAFSPDGKGLASGGHDGKVRLWNLATREERAILGEHRAVINCLAFSPDGNTLATSNGNNDQQGNEKAGQVRLWEVATGRERALSLEHNEGATELAFSPGGRTLAAGEESGAVRLWDLATGKERIVLEGHKKPVIWLAFTSDGKRLASGTGEDVKLWEVELPEAVGSRGKVPLK
jgi:WD40 repeat protein